MEAYSIFGDYNQRVMKTEVEDALENYGSSPKCKGEKTNSFKSETLQEDENEYHLFTNNLKLERSYFDEFNDNIVTTAIKTELEDAGENYNSDARSIVSVADKTYTPLVVVKFEPETMQEDENVELLYENQCKLEMKLETFDEFSNEYTNSIYFEEFNKSIINSDTTNSNNGFGSEENITTQSEDTSNEESKYVECDDETKNPLPLTHQLIHTDVNNKPFKCDRCYYQSETEHQLRRHQYVHTEERPFKCNKCDYLAKSMPNLKIHLNKHTEVRPFKCKKCTYQSKTEYSLRIHQRVHTDLRPFKCDKCDYSAKYKHCLRLHQIKHTDERPYKCNLCSHRAKTEYHLNIHQFVHTEERPFKCDQCDYSAKNKMLLGRHLIRIHRRYSSMIKLGQHSNV